MRREHGHALRERLAQPTDGVIEIGVADGQDIRRRVGLVGHGLWLYDDLTAAENLRFFGELYGVPELPASIQKWLARVGLEGCSHLPVRALSAGQKRRLTLARLALDPATLWILDEPATNLDAEGFALVEQLLREHVARGGIAIAAAHQRLLANEPCMSALELSA